MVIMASYQFQCAIGVIGTGLMAIPVLSGSLSYILAETFGWEQGLDKKFHEAKGFYVVIAISLLLVLSINYIGISPIKALIYTAILYGITAPVLIAIILHLSNNKKNNRGIWEWPYTKYFRIHCINHYDACCWAINLFANNGLTILLVKTIELPWPIV